MRILITGGAGFIGSAVAKALMDRGDFPILIDNFNDYYDPKLKRDRIGVFLGDYAGKFSLYEGDIRDRTFLGDVFGSEKPEKVIHLAAMAGVRYSLERPELYADVNMMGTLNMLECARNSGVLNFVYASSSSVYGENEKVPFSESDPVDHPVSVYAATKKSTELLANVYSHVWGLHTTGLRFFTVYGPWGRPDMGVFKFVANIVEGRPIDVYNGGEMRRNFTYIDDIVSGTLVTLDADLPCDVMNIGGDRDEALMDYIAAVERHAGRKAETNMLPMQRGDVTRTVADISKLRALGWAPSTRIDDGIARFVEWYRSYYSPRVSGDV
ncbi:MAG: NAD-dependent epimerase/dehydratase family protein [Candidatus Moranbacteria bacterium]|nr:NAD-dependent epimerase/dehydratase family protein [Candidatus Moranbacteria bacterium]NTW45744.1 NAD-dependent epimerase/dehydratase family protein [Candidatus Moranbacteria bacterium]